MTDEELDSLDGALIADGFDDALIGVAHRADGQTIAVYDYERCVDVLVERDGMDYEGAVEFISLSPSRSKPWILRALSAERKRPGQSMSGAELLGCQTRGRLLYESA